MKGRTVILPVVYDNLRTVISHLPPVTFLGVLVVVERLRLKIPRIVVLVLRLIVGRWKVMIFEGDDSRRCGHSHKSRVLGHNRVLEHDLTGSALGA